MRSKILKWGNSLAFRIPKAFAEDIGLKEDSPVEVQKTENQIILMPVKYKKYSLRSMVAMINEDNLHHEMKTGKPVGHEAW